jgi:uncharacterized protein
LTLYYLESSSLAKLFVRESGTDRLIALAETLIQAQKLVSSLSRVEVHSAVRRRERQGDLSPSDAREALEILAVEFAEMTEQPVTSSVIEVAQQMVDRHALRALDAVQLASCWAVRAASGISDIVFIASDSALLRAAVAEGLQTWNPEEDHLGGAPGSRR